MHGLVVLATEGGLLTCSLINYFVPTYRGQSAEISHDAYVCGPIYRGHSADM